MKLNHLPLIKQACIAAGEAIMKIYESESFEVELKSNNSPLTRADKAAHEVIMGFLEQTGFPILSEEGKNIAYEERRKWKRFWMVDPLDGTKEFIKKNGEFTVNIALILETETIFGAVYVPVSKTLYYGGKSIRATKEIYEMGQTAPSEMLLSENPHPLSLKQKISITRLEVVASRSHLNLETADFLAELEQPQLVSMGSSLKFMALADGKAQIYPRFAPTMEWDTAAAHAILSSLQYRVDVKETGQPLLYNKPNLLNPSFICY